MPEARSEFKFQGSFELFRGALMRICEVLRVIVIQSYTLF